MQRDYRYLSERERRPEHQLALWALSGAWDEPLPVPVGEVRRRGDEFFRFAKRNRIESIVGHALLARQVVGGEAAEPWRRAHGSWDGRIRWYMDVVDRVAERLADAGIPLVALKNAGIARALHPCAGCCPMGDVDLLTTRERFREAHEILLDMGFALGTRGAVEPADIEAGLESGGTEYRFTEGDRSMWLELQWRPVSGRWLPQDMEPEASAVIAASRPIAGTEVRILAPEDNLLSVALHTAKHSYVRAPGLRLHTDVQRIVRAQDIDWHIFLQNVRRRAVAAPVYFSLDMSRELVGAEIPAWVLDALSPSLWKRDVVAHWLRKVGVFEPDERKFRRWEALAFQVLLFDDVRGLAAAASGLGRGEVEWRNWGRILRHLPGRLWDLATRFQR